MTYLTSDLPTNPEEWDILWQEIKEEERLRTDRECYQFLTQMVLAITSNMVELGSSDKHYGEWQTFVHLVFDEWTVYDNLLNEFND